MHTLVSVGVKGVWVVCVKETGAGLYKFLVTKSDLQYLFLEQSWLLEVVWKDVPVQRLRLHICLLHVTCPKGRTEYGD